MPEPPLKKTHCAALSAPRFWEIIDQSRHGSKGDCQAIKQRMARLLRPLTPLELVAFEYRYTWLIRNAYRWNIWDAAGIICHGCSDDGFWDFRGWLIAQGKDAYERALADPESMGTLIEPDDPQRHHLNVSSQAMFVWAEKVHGDPEEIDDFPMFLGSNLGEEPDGECCAEDQAALAARFPRLWRKFGEKSRRRNQM